MYEYCISNKLHLHNLIKIATIFYNLNRYDRVDVQYGDVYFLFFISLKLLDYINFFMKKVYHNYNAKVWIS